MDLYNHKDIEKKWQKKWTEDNVYKTSDDSNKEKCYVLDMFPYPSGAGLHVGHPKGYIATDVYSRFKKATGHNVLHPMGWDAFGLPAENYAIKNKVQPQRAVDENVEKFKKQLEHIGFSYDWDRELNTTDPKYYKWTQWAFIQMFKKGLAYESNEPINWCPSCKTGLANEDLESDGTCERCGSQVEKKPIRQWVLKITDYADRLLEDLDTLKKWPKSIKESQKNWIGRSEGAEFDFKIKDIDSNIKVFTTRADTIFGVTYVVLAPENELVKRLNDKIQNIDEVNEYIKESKNKSTIDRTAEGKEKTGVKLKGITAINPVNNEEVPVWIADYVLNSYGTGAVMAVPAHDERDFKFAKKYDLGIKRVVEPAFYGTDGDGSIKPELPFKKREAICAVVKNPKDDKYLVVSWKDHLMNGLVTGGIDDGETAEETAKREILEETGYKNLKHTRTSDIKINTFFYHRVKKENRHAHFTFVFFELEDDERDKISEEEKNLHDVLWKSKEELKDFFTVFEGDFIVDILDNDDYAVLESGILINSDKFSGLKSDKAIKQIADEYGKEKVTYRLQDWVFSRQRYWGEPIPLIHCEKCGVVPVPEKDLPVTLPDVESYEPTGTGESPLANIEDWVNTKCPECGGDGKRETNTMPQWAGSCWYYLRYMDPENDSALVDKEKEQYWSPVDLYVGGAEHATRHLIYARFWHKFLYDIGVVSTTEPFMELKSVGLILAEDGRKMSKRYGNVVNPDDVVNNMGADTLRVYEMFMGPFEGAISWSTDNMVGSRRFIERVWRLQSKISKDVDIDKNLETVMHKTIKKVTDDIENFSHNTAISQLMIFLNEIDKKDSIPYDVLKNYVILLAPFAPHISQEIWTNIGESGYIYNQQWLEYDDNKIIEDKITIAVQINGKVRGQIEVKSDESELEVQEKAKEEENVKRHLEGEEIKKIIYIKNKIINIVV